MTMPNFFYLKCEPWWIGMNETFTGKHLKLSSFISHNKNYTAQEKVKTFEETFSFHLASNSSNYLDQMYLFLIY